MLDDDFWNELKKGNGFIGDVSNSSGDEYHQVLLLDPF